MMELSVQYMTGQCCMKQMQKVPKKILKTSLSFLLETMKCQNQCDWCEGRTIDVGGVVLNQCWF